MPPKLNGLDHIHVYVSSREKAAEWYKKVLGFTVTKKLEVWAEDKNGPLTIEDSTGNIHLALFEVENPIPSAAIAFKANGKEFLDWKLYLEKENLLPGCVDHSLSWSLYFSDLDGNKHEITSYEYKYISEHVKLNPSDCQ